MASIIIGMPEPLPSAGEPAPSGSGTIDMSFMSVALRHRELPSNKFSRVFPPYRPPGFVTSIRSSKTSTATDCPQNRSPYSRWITALAIASRRTSSGISSESTRETPWIVEVRRKFLATAATASEIISPNVPSQIVRSMNLNDPAAPFCVPA